MKSLLVLLLVTVVVVMNMSQSYGTLTEDKKEDVVYFSLEENSEVIKERVSDAFWDNPLNTPPLLILIGIAGMGIIVAWKRKWHIHEKKQDF